MAIKALTKIKHDGHWYEPGDTLTKITSEAAKRLVDLGVAEEKTKEPAKKASE